LPTNVIIYLLYNDPHTEWVKGPSSKHEIKFEGLKVIRIMYKIKVYLHSAFIQIQLWSQSAEK